jgi:hypothetical protein
MLDIPSYFLVLSAAPIMGLFLVALVLGWLGRKRRANELRKEGFLDGLGMGFEARPRVRLDGATRKVDGGWEVDDQADGVRRRKAGGRGQLKDEMKEKVDKEGKKPIMDRPLIVGFWHPYW